ncbi:helix-turn-helix transcriptional regulator [Kitasatospora sp. NPDC056651]|uniref:helix-turn-helix transcriptional regulator n=1 Tax=Kitasatospora sp. NPDC056651 TaxID=3345892 RepID=UPI00368AA399
MAVKRERLAHRRKDAGHTQETLADALGVHRSTVVRWERGQGDPQPWMWVKLARLLRISTTELRAIFAAPDQPATVVEPAPAPRAEGPHLLTPLPDLGDADIGPPELGDPEQEAATVGSSMALMGDGVRVGCRTSDGRIIFVTMPRRDILRSAAAAAGATLVVGTASAPAAKPLLSPDLHPVENLRRLRKSLVECDNVLGPRDVIASALDHLRLIQQLRRDAAGRDRQGLMQVQAEYAEFSSWLYQDSGDHRAAQYWADRALDWSNAAGDHELTVYVTARKAQLAGDMKESLDAIDLAESAQRIAPPGSRLVAMARVYAAHGHALAGDEPACQRAYDEALELVTGPRDVPVSRGRWLEAAYVEAQRARSLAVLGRYEVAVSRFDQAIRALPASFRRDRGVYLARSAGAQLRAVGPEQAAITAIEALSVAVATGSGRIFGELASLDHQLQRWQTVAEVVQFRQALDSVMLHEV